MTAISACSENQFYNLGIQYLIKELKDQSDNRLHENNETDSAQEKNILFYEDLAVTSSVEHKADQPRFVIFIIFCTKNRFLAEIKAILSRILKISQLSRKEITYHNKMKETLPSGCEQLTFHEMKIVKLLAKGNSIATIAKIMNCTNSTIYTHRRNILRKTRTTNRQRLNKIIQALKNHDTKYSHILLL